jgi:FlaA1/EpsC-like NDP-sugar epimerase
MSPTRFRFVEQIHGALDLAVLAGAYCSAYMLRFEWSLPPSIPSLMLLSLLYVVPLEYLCLYLFNVHKSPWRYVGIKDASVILLALTIANGALVGCRLTADYATSLRALRLVSTLPVSVLFINLLVSFQVLTGLRASHRLLVSLFARYAPRLPSYPQIPTILIGAGQAGALVANEIVTRRDFGIRPVGFLDDDPSKRGLRIHGIPVIGTTDELDKIAQQHGVQQALITIGNLTGSHIRRIAEKCEKCRISAKIIPGIRELVEGRLSLSAFRDVSIEDILHRDQVAMDCQAVDDLVRGSKALVTGAGGSIGSQLCRQLCCLGVDVLILVERSENALFHVHRELAQTFPEARLLPCLADINDTARMEALFLDWRPTLIFHAAAHKHVPMVEWNPGEAVNNNVLATRKLADLAHAVGVPRVVLISSDKAVNPTSVMGVTKRVAELYVQALARRSNTRFMTVRFGNVLGSNGSVVPIFKEQIARGGPVTVTHPDMQRYFMTIPEACQLILQATGLGRGGEIFILDMGQQIKIVDLARKMIRLSGLTPADIEIKFVGIRPGEKLFEELHANGESVQATPHPKILKCSVKPREWAEINYLVDELSALVHCGDAEKLLLKLREIVPEFQIKPISTSNGKEKVARHSEKSVSVVDDSGDYLAAPQAPMSSDP